MAIRDKLRSAAAPYLEPGEQIEQVFIAHAGARPWAMLGFLFGLVGLVAVYAIKPLIIAVTDRSIVVLQGSRFRSAKAKALLARLPRQTRLGPATAKVWSKLNVAGQRMWVARQFAVDVTQADAPLLNPPPPAAPAPPVDSAPPVAAGEPTAGTWGWSAPAPPTDLPPAAAPPPMAPPAQTVAVQTGRWPLDTGLSRTGQWVLGIAGLVVTVLIVAGAVGANNENDARQRLKDYIAGGGHHSFFAADGRFRAEFPGPPTRSTQTEQVAGYTLNTVLYQRDVGLDSSFIVTYVDFPLAPPDPTGALNGAANGVAVASKGEVLTATPTTYAGRQALEAIISIRLKGGTTGTHFAKTLLVIDGVRLYSVSVFDKVNPPGGYEGFVKSFEIVPG